MGAPKKAMTSEEALRPAIETARAANQGLAEVADDGREPPGLEACPYKRCLFGRKRRCPYQLSTDLKPKPAFPRHAGRKTPTQWVQAGPRRGSALFPSEAQGRAGPARGGVKGGF